MNFPIPFSFNEFKRRLRDGHSDSFRGNELKTMITGVQYNNRPFSEQYVDKGYVFVSGEMFIKLKSVYDALVEAGRVTDPKNLTKTDSIHQGVITPTAPPFSPGTRLPRYPSGRGIFVLKDETQKVLFVGTSEYLSSDASHLTIARDDIKRGRGCLHQLAEPIRNHQKNGHTVSIEFCECDDTRRLGSDLIKSLKPAWNNGVVPKIKKARKVSRIRGTRQKRNKRTKTV